jgi:hypothetical protein
MTAHESPWFDVLGWKQSPNWGICHHYGSKKEFDLSYFRSPDLEKFENGLLQTLTGNFEHLNQRILGAPGCGKTTFVYSLVRFNGHNELAKRYFFEIFHINRAADGDTTKLVQSAVLKAWKRYYADAGQSAIFEKIEQAKVDEREKLNRCSDHFKSNRSQFHKTMIFVIDDVDLLTGEEALAVVSAVMRNLEVAQVKKWLMMRESTYQGYTPEQRLRINSFFPRERAFPSLDAHAVVTHRVTNTSGGETPKMPFSQTLCSFLAKLYNGNLREILGVLEEVIQSTEPTNLRESTDELFIQQMCDRRIVKLLLENRHLVNIHEQRFRPIPLPIAFDALRMIRYLQDAELAFTAVAEIESYRVAQLKDRTPYERLRIRTRDFENALQALEHAGLVSRSRRLVELTPLGDVVETFCDQQYYEDFTLRELGLSENDSLYVLLLNIKIDHQSFALLGLSDLDR